MSVIYLASSSPRRRELLEQIQLPFTVTAANVDESLPPGLSPSEQVLALSCRKALAAREKIKNLPSGLVIGADTIVVLEELVLGKPLNQEEAYTMLAQLQGKTHRVFTGITLLETKAGRMLTDYEETEVQMRKASPEELRRYLKTSEYTDKAGAYGIQGTAAVFITGIKGCYYNVMGLPLAKLTLMLKKMAVDVSAYWR